ncbi:MAG: GAF domain-containing protein [Muribaculaceae bacterium]|nr:GAF domain-containing protein [Muribaculaceae bacterium]MBR1474045.1 GAF domain-containing protein [Muribaculaceae bacterium]
MKQKLYDNLLEQLQGLIAGEDNLTSVLANASALMRDVMGERFFWVGFYLVDGDRLVLGPFQGSVACYRIGRGRGVCGTAWAKATTQVVPDVERFPGHIACSSLSRSEIVVPLIDGGGVVRGVLDIDSKELAQFDDTDARNLERAAAIIARVLW